jgi:hypothetical protein
MSDPNDDGRIGYGRPPKATRWKKGQSGNPGRRAPAHSESAVEMIDESLSRPIEIIENGASRQAPTLEMILLQLWLKGLSGSRKAQKVLQKYEQLAKQDVERKVEIVFVDHDSATDFETERSREDPRDE